MRAEFVWLFTIIGTVVGSFLALVSLRLPAGRKFAFGRSQCSACGRVLKPLDLVPLISFLALRGRCRTCHARIERRYALVELAAALIGLASALAYPDVQAVAAALLGWWLLLLVLLDLDSFWLPDRLTIPLCPAGLLATFWFNPAFLLHAVAGAAVGFLVFEGLAAAYRRLRGREGLGGGDAKLFAAAGAWLGWQSLPYVLLLASLSGLVAALLMLRGKEDFMTRQLPFGPCLAPPIWLLYLAGFGERFG